MSRPSVGAIRLDPADDWTCAVWPTAGGPCGAPAVERLVMLNQNMPDLPVCASCYAASDQGRMSA